MACNCSLNDVTLPTAQSGNDGADGINGKDGLFGGFSQKFIFETTLTSNPLTTKLRFNNSTLASVTEVYVNDNNSDSVNIDAFLDALNNSGNGGKIKIFKEYDSTTFFMADLSSSTDNGSDHTLAVTHIASNGTFANDDQVVLSFVSNGVIGTNGLDGTPLLFADTNNDINTSKALTAFANKSYTLPANTLTADGDSIQGIAYFYSSSVTDEKAAQAIVELHIGGSKAYTGLLVQNAGRQYSMIEYVFTRTSVVAGRLTLKFCKEYSSPQLLTSTITGLDFTTTTVIQLYSTEVSSQNFHCNKHLITLLKQ